MADGRTGIQVEGLDELRAGFKRAGQRRAFDGALRKAHRVIARDVTASIKATGGTKQQNAAKKALLGQGKPLSADVLIRRTPAIPYGIGAYMGSIQFKQFPFWVGDAWDIADGSGPYVVAPGIAKKLPEVQERYAEDIADVLSTFGVYMTK